MIFHETAPENEPRSIFCRKKSTRDPVLFLEKHGKVRCAASYVEDTCLCLEGHDATAFTVLCDHNGEAPCRSSLLLWRSLSDKNITACP